MKYKKNLKKIKKMKR